MILHIFRKDLKLLWRVVLLVAIGQFVLAGMLFHIDHATVGKNPYGLLLQLMLFVTFLGRAVLIVMCVQQDAIPGLSQDWLTRPIKRTDLLFAKLLFVLVFAQGPVFLADSLQAITGGASISHSIGTAAIRSLFLLPLFLLPFLAFGAITKNLTEAIAGAVVFFLFLAGSQMLFVGLSEGRKILEVSPTTLTGFDWLPDAFRLVVTLGAVLLILGLQYLRRNTSSSRMILVAAALLCVLVRLIPWNVAYAMQQSVSKNTTADLPVALTFAANQKPYSRGSGITGDILQGQYGGTKDADTIIYLPLEVSGLPEGGILKSDRASVRMVTSDGQAFVLGVAGDFEPMPRGSVPNTTYSPLYIPNALYKRFAHEPVRLEVDYSATLLKREDMGSMAALNGQRDFRTIGRCSTRMNSAETAIDVRCLQPGTIPLCTAAVLTDGSSNLQNPSKVSCLPNYAPIYPMMIPDGMSRYSVTLPFRDPNSSSNYPVQGKRLATSKVDIAVYTGDDHFNRRVLLSDIRMEDWLPH